MTGSGLLTVVENDGEADEAVVFIRQADDPKGSEWSDCVMLYPHQIDQLIIDLLEAKKKALAFTDV